MEADPTYNINVSGDIKQMLRELGTEKAKEIAQLGGGGNKARNERAAVLAAILEARSRIKAEPSGKGESPKQGFSIVDAASASIQGRSANAAKTATNDKTAARIALHMAGERAPVNAKLVSIFLHYPFFTKMILCLVQGYLHLSVHHVISQLRTPSFFGLNNFLCICI